MLTITRNELTISVKDNTIPSRGSANVGIKLENDGSYGGYIENIHCGYYLNGIYKECILKKEAAGFIIPGEVFKNCGIMNIAVALIKNNEILKTNQINFTIKQAPTGNIILPDSATWHELVSDYMEDYKKINFDPVLEAANNANEKTNDMQVDLLDILNHLGEYEWSGTRIRFKKGNETWGEWKDIAGDFAKKADVAALTNAFNSVTSLTKQMFLLMHPIGCIYLSTSSVSPQTTFGGTWVRWGNGRVPVGVDSSDSSFNTVEKTGGEKQHTLTTSEMPAHAHQLSGTSLKSVGNGTDGTGLGINGSDKRDLISNIGGNQPHNNLQPYITCYMWKRTA